MQPGAGSSVAHGATDGGGTVPICCLPYSHLIVDHASLSRRSIVSTPTINRDTFNIWALISFFFDALHNYNFFLSHPLPVSPFLATIYPRTAIVFSGAGGMTGGNRCRGKATTHFLHMYPPGNPWINSKRVPCYIIGIIYLTALSSRANGGITFTIIK